MGDWGKKPDKGINQWKTSRTRWGNVEEKSKDLLCRYCRWKNLPTLTRIRKEKPTSRSMKNLLTQWELRRKTDPKPESWGYCFLAFLLEPLVGGRSCSRLVLRGRVVEGRTIVGQDRRGWPEALLRCEAKPSWAEDIRGETGWDKVLFSF